MKAPITLLGFAVIAFLTLPFATTSALSQIPENVLVNNPAADLTSRDTQSGTAIVLGDGNSVIIAFNDSGSYIGANYQVSGWARSTDGGASFTDLGALPNTPSGDGGYINLARNNQTGVIYLSVVGFMNPGLNVFRSTNNGASFINPPTPIATGNVDFSSIAVDNFPGTGQGNLYITWKDFIAESAIRFKKSTDAGLTFSPPVVIQSAAAGNLNGPSMAIASDHTIYIAYLDEAAPKSIKIRKSIDRGSTFASPVTVAGVSASGYNGNLGLGFTAMAIPKLAVNPKNGHLYVVYPDKGQLTDRADIYLTQSTDGGATWSPRVKVNNDTTTNDQYQPVLAVTPNGSRLFTGFYDRRRDPANTQIDVYGMVADATGDVVTTTANFRISSESFPPAYGQDSSLNSTYMGHYDTATADNSFFYYPWGDNRLGNSFHSHQPDIRMAKIPVEGIPTADVISDGIALVGELDDNALNPNECNTLTVGLRNTGNIPLTTIFTTISSTDPGVTIVQSASAYPNLDAGTSSTNLEAFTISTSSAFPCYKGAGISMNISTSQGNFTLPVALPGTSLATIAHTASFSNAIPLAIPDNDTVISNMEVSGLSNLVVKATVKVHATHTYSGDLRIRLVSPEGASIPLVTNRGAAGDNFGAGCSPETIRTIFDDEAITPVSAATAPFIGTFRPESPLSALRGTPGAAANGTWKLVVQDTGISDIGTLQCWSLDILTGPCIQGTAPCATAAGNWTIFE